ncbi:hypothetical protein EMIT0324P_110109 [Pseudomonas chlororaphis]
MPARHEEGAPLHHRQIPPYPKQERSLLAIAVCLTPHTASIAGKPGSYRNCGSLTA